MSTVTAPTSSHHVATVDLGARGTADVYIREAGMIDVDMPTSRGTTYTLGSDPVTTAQIADALEAGDSTGFGDLTPAAMTALATALRAGIAAEGVHQSDTPAERRSPCPTWCEASDQPDHWEHTGSLFQAQHVRRFGTVTVYVPQELHDDGARWIGRCEVVIHHDDHTQQMDGETTLTPQESSALAANLREAARFTARMDQQVAALVAQGVVTSEQVTR